MNRAFHTGIVLAVAVHMVFGCCSHHAHAYGERFDSQALAVEASCPCGHGSSEPVQSCDHTSRHPQCHGDRCVFTRRDSNDAPDLSIGHGCLNPVCVSACTGTFGIGTLGIGTLGTGTFGGVDRVDSCLGKLGSSVPLHLLNQAFLL